MESLRAWRLGLEAKVASNTRRRRAARILPVQVKHFIIGGALVTGTLSAHRRRRLVILTNDMLLFFLSSFGSTIPAITSQRDMDVVMRITGAMLRSATY